MQINKVNKLNFFKKIWYSISNINKYAELREEGVLTSITYFFNSMLLICLILGILCSFLHIRFFKEEVKYIDNTLPELSIKENVLNVEGNKEIVLDRETFKRGFGSIVVVNTEINEQQAIDKYYQLTSKNNLALIFLNDRCILLSNNYNPESDSKDGLKEYLYSEELTKYFSETKEEYNKKDIMEYLESSISVTRLFAQYYVSYFISIGILYLFYILLISLVLWGMTSLLKLNWGFKNTLMNTIYSSTLSWLIFTGYLALSVIVGFSIPIFDVINIVLIFVYISTLMYKDKKKLKEEEAQK